MKNRIFAVLMSLAMMLGVFAFAIPAAADEPQASVPMANNTDVVLNGITFRFDPLGTHPNSKAEVNADGTVTLTMREGDLFWIPSVTIDAQSELDMSVLMVSNNGGKNNCQMASGVAWKVDAGDNNAWGEDTDNTNILNLQTAARRRICNGTVYQMSHDQITKVGVQAGNTDNNATLAAFIGSRKLWECNTVLRMKVYVKNDDGTDYVRGDICNVDGDVLTYDYYALSDTAPKTMEGSVGYCVNWDGDGSNDGDMVITIQNFTVKNALVGGVRGDFDMVSVLENAELEVPAMTFAGETKAAFDGNDVELEFELGVDASVPETAELVVKRGTAEIARTALSALEKGTNGYLWETELEGVENTETLMFSLESAGTLIERSELTYALGAAYLAYLNSQGKPVAESAINAVSYSENFDGLNMTLVPGENIVNGQRWLYVKNSENGSARIADGKLYITGNSYDRILFLDQVYNHINYRFSMTVNYAEAPEKVRLEGEAPDTQEVGAVGYVGGIFNLQEADGEGNRNAVIAAVTPDYLYLKQVQLKADGTIDPKEERGDCPIGTLAADGKWSQYWSAVQPGTPFYLFAYSGISDIGNGEFGIKPRNADQSNKGWGNGYGISEGYRTGMMGIFLGEGQASAYIDDIKVEVQGTMIKVDGADFPIWGNGEIKVSSLQRSGEKFLYATVNGALKYAGDTITANRKTKITTSQITLSTRKVVADGETGLKWRTEINKADYDRLAADENIKSIELGTVVVPTANIAGGLTKEAAGVADIAAGSAWSATSDTAYTFEGVRTVAKAERDTSYSGVGYLKVTMKDDTVIVVYADYVTRNHAYALSDLVSVFHDNDDPAPGTDPANTRTDENNTTAAPEETTETAKKKKKGCGSTVLGAGAVLTVAILGGVCIFARRKENEE